MLARTDPDEDPVLKTIATALAKPTPYMYVCLEQSKSDSLSFIPVTDFETIDFDAQDILLSKVRSQQIRQKEGLLVPHGIFDYSFRSLNNVTKNYQNLALGSFKPILESEQQRTGESFEALGIKFPADETTRWGTLVLLAIQLYLWVILRENVVTISPADSGWDVAWIGMYTSAIARIVCFLTTVAFPPVAIVTLGIRALQLGGDTWFDRLLVCFDVSVSVIFAFLAWRSLPKRTPL